MTAIAGSIRRKASAASIEAGDDAGLARHHSRLGLQRGGHDRVGRDVAGAAEILEQGRADDRLD